MIQINNAGISKITLQKVGNKVREEKNISAQELLHIKEKEEEAFIPFFLNPFKKQLEAYRFTHYTGELDYNILYSLCKKLFSEEIEFLDSSTQILNHLYEVSNHPNIKSGELFIIKFENIIIEKEQSAALGIFKLENPKKFIRFKHTDFIDFNIQKGYKLEGIDKGCLIFPAENNSFKIFTIDDNHYESEYWKKEFLQIDFITDHAFQTKNYLNLFNEFSKEILSKDSEKNTSINFLSDTVKLFNEKEDIDNFMIENELIKKYEMLDQFKNFKKDYSESYKVEFWDEFTISKSVVNQHKKKLKSEIKLDNDIQIKFNLAKTETEDYIEKGFDEIKKMHYYKIYFNEEI